MQPIVRDDPRTTPPKVAALRLLRNEERPDYDGHPVAEQADMTAARGEVVERIFAEVGATALGVYCYLERHADDAGESAVSYAAMAARCGLTERRIKQIVHALRDAGFVEVREHFGRRGMQLESTFVLPLHRSQGSSTYRDETTHETTHERGGETSCGGVPPSARRPVSTSSLLTPYSSIANENAETTSPAAEPPPPPLPLRERYDRRYQDEANKVAVLVDLFNELWPGRKGDYGRLGALNKRLNAGAKTIALMIEASAQRISDDPHDYLDKMVSRVKERGERSGPNGASPNGRPGYRAVERSSKALAAMTPEEREERNRNVAAWREYTSHHAFVGYDEFLAMREREGAPR